jgi:alkylation response protein AidB-like acyl-CoA dehydrogenase
MGFNRGALHPVLVAGTPEQQQVFVRDLLRAGGYAALALTEPDMSGSNVMTLETTAVRTDSGWRIDGTKCMVGNAGVADLFLVLARVEDGGRSRGLGFFAVPRSAGVEVGPNTDKLGFRAVETPVVRFRGAEVGDTHRIGAPGAGPATLVETLACIRVGGAAVISGIAAGALADALPWVAERRVYGGTLGQKSHVQLQLGALYGRLLSVRQMIREAAALRDAGVPYAIEASVAKLEASKLALDATAQVSQLFGWRGIDNDWPIQKRFRDARQTPIFEGTTELQCLNLFRTLHARHRDSGSF